ncbi:MAG: Uma2 family endonuclease [Fimbriiglobus sp.]
MARAKRIIYPSCDGKRIAEHTLQFEWITRLWCNLGTLFRDRVDVFVAADNLIYPVEGDNRTREAPDVYVAIGRPRGNRDNYRVWDEGGNFPQVVFEVRPPAPSDAVMARKLDFYSRYGAQEYYDFDPFAHRLRVYRRAGDGSLRLRPEVEVFRSPLLGIWFHIRPGRSTVFFADGTPFRTLPELSTVVERRDSDEARRQLADEAECWADAMAAETRRLEAKLRSLGIDPNAA